MWEDVDNSQISSIDYYDKAYANTRQLDYYKAKGINTDKYSKAIKKNLSGSVYQWWLRSAGYSNDRIFFNVITSGDRGDYYASSTIGVSPAFCIG